HAHCDLLSFELDLAGLPFAVDAGVSGYADAPLREFVRSTRAHNTVVIGGREQSEIWGVYRVARMAEVMRAGASVGVSIGAGASAEAGASTGAGASASATAGDGGATGATGLPGLPGQAW